jgi:uncharacterized protein YdeI (YjbR/CyaY-like superfamily)
MFRRRFTPRRPDGTWSQRNVVMATRILVEGRMHRTGLTVVEQAKADGRWDHVNAGQATIEVPTSPAAALEETPQSKAMFEHVRSADRYSVLYRVTTETRTEARSGRIEQFVAMRAPGETIRPRW